MDEPVYIKCEVDYCSVTEESPSETALSITEDGGAGLDRKGGGGEDNNVCSKTVKPGYCAECEMYFHFLSSHNRAFHRGKVERRCTFCGQLFFSRVKLLRHLLQHDSNKIKCSYCENHYPEFEDLYKHLEEHRFLHIYLCDQCPKTFAVKSNFDDHLVTHSSPWRRAYLECLKCKMMFEARTGGMKKLQKHYIKSHNNNLRCVYCRKKFTKFVSFYVHCMRHKNNLPYICDGCGLGFRKNCLLRDHIQTYHLNVHNYSCSQCGRQFKYKPAFDAHFRFHDESLRFACNYCAKLFIRKVSLIDHFMEKSCSACDKSFHCSTMFNSHFESFHKNDCMFECDKCSKSYKTESQLKRHRTMEHVQRSESMFQCPLCPYHTTTRHNLNRHRRRHHEK